MKNDEFTQCPLCEGQLEQCTVLDHPEKGIILEVPHHMCLKCGEVFLNEDAFDLVHSYKRIEKISA